MQSMVMKSFFAVLIASNSLYGMQEAKVELLMITAHTPITMPSELELEKMIHDSYVGHIFCDNSKIFSLMYANQQITIFQIACIYNNLLIFYSNFLQKTSLDAESFQTVMLHTYETLGNLMHAILKPHSGAIEVFDYLVFGVM